MEFRVEKKQKSVTLDTINECFDESIRTRSITPMTMLFRKGRYGSRGTLKGSLIDANKYERRKGKRINFLVVE